MSLVEWMGLALIAAMAVVFVWAIVTAFRFIGSDDFPPLFVWEEEDDAE